MGFITICTENREKLFGEILNDNVGADPCVCPVFKPNNAGEMIEKWLLELSNKFKNIKCDEYVIMPNHIHFIIEILNQQGEHIGSPLQKSFEFVGVDLRVYPKLRFYYSNKNPVKGELAFAYLLSSTIFAR